MSTGSMAGPITGAGSSTAGGLSHGGWAAMRVIRGGICASPLAGSASSGSSSIAIAEPSRGGARADRIPRAASKVLCTALRAAQMRHRFS